jgi:hypothetical protein
MVSNGGMQPALATYGRNSLRLDNLVGSSFAVFSITSQMGDTQRSRGYVFAHLDPQRAGRSRAGDLARGSAATARGRTPSVGFSLDRTLSRLR